MLALRVCLVIRVVCPVGGILFHAPRNRGWDQSPSRWVINFRDWPVERAMQYPGCFEIVERLVKPEREKNNRKVRRERWWQFAERASELYERIAGLQRVLVVSLVNNHLGFGVVPTAQVFAHRLAVIVSSSFTVFALFQSHVHYYWAWTYSSTMRRDINYSPSDCVETFPFPPRLDSMENIGQRYHNHRQQTMAVRREGLTATYNRFHSPNEVSRDMATLRALHVEMDNAVAAAYGWTHLDLGHGFHETKQGIRFTISEAARREVLDRLLALNHERYAQEQAATVAPRARRAGKPKRAREESLFAAEEISD